MRMCTRRDWCWVFMEDGGAGDDEVNAARLRSRALSRARTERAATILQLRTVIAYCMPYKMVEYTSST